MSGVKLEFVNFLDFIFSCVSGILLICSIKREKIAAISFALLLAVSLIGAFNYFFSAFRYPQYFVHFTVKLCDVAFYVMAIIALFYKKPLKKVVCAMAVMPAVGAVLNGIYYIATVEWSGRFIVFYPYSTYFISMILMAVAMAGSNVKKRSGNENIGLAGLTLIVIGYAMTLSFLIVSTAFPFENLLALRNLTVIYMALSSVINVTGYVLLPWLINYSPKKLYGGKVMDAESGYVNVFLHILFPAQPLIYGIGYGCTEYHPLYADTREDRDFLQQSTSCSTFCCLSTIYTGFADTDTIFLSKKRRTASAVKT